MDESVVRVFHSFVRDFNPSIRIINGDLFDLTCLRIGATATEKSVSLETDLEYGLEFLSKFPPTDFNYGNHEDRLMKLRADPNSEIRLAAKMIMEKIAKEIPYCHIRPYDTIKGIMKLGNLNVLHGFGRGGKTCAREHAIAFGPCVIGHGHRIEYEKIASRNRLVCNMGGCLCKPHLDYNKALIGAMNQENGWPYGLLYPTGEYQLFQAQRKAGRWMFPTEFTEYR